MSDNDDFVSFDKTLRELKLQSEQLKKMVSQGDIRAFRVGDSMQFRAEDVRALTSRNAAEEELVFADALEDDTGMVTEELSEEDTLLVEDDLEEEDDEPRVVRSRREVISATQEKQAEHPIWAAVAILSFVALLWGALLCWDISVGASPGSSMANKLWAE